MADSFIQLPADGVGKKVDTRTEGTNSEHREVHVIGDPATNDAVASVLNTQPTTEYGVVVRALVEGDVAHDTGDANYPVKIGGKAKTYGSLPTAVIDADRVNGLFDRYGAQFVQMGSSFVQAITASYTADQTNVDIIGAIGAGTAYRVYGYILDVDYSAQTTQTFTIGFGATTTPTTAGCILKKNGVIPGFYPVIFTAPITGGSGEELRITSTGYTAGTNNITIFYDTVSI